MVDAQHGNVVHVAAFSEQQRPILDAKHGRPDRACWTNALPFGVHMLSDRPDAAENNPPYREHRTNRKEAAPLRAPESPRLRGARRKATLETPGSIALRTLSISKRSLRLFHDRLGRGVQLLQQILQLRAVHRGDVEVQALR